MNALFNSNSNYLKRFTEGSFTVVGDGVGGLVTTEITHGLGYVPLFRAAFDPDPGNFGSSADYMVEVGASGLLIHDGDVSDGVLAGAYSTTTKFGVNISSFTTQTYTFFYAVYIDPSLGTQ